MGYLVEKVVDIAKTKDLSVFYKPIEKKGILRIPMQFKQKTRLNKIIGKYVTRDLFPRGKVGDKRFKEWKKEPVRHIMYFDRICEEKGFSFLEKSSGRYSVLINILKRIRRMNKMEQLDKETEMKLKKIEDTKMIRTSEKEKVPDLLNSDFIEDIKKRAKALAQEDQYKKKLIEKAKEQGWLGVTVEEIDLDMSDVYRRLAKQVEYIHEFDKESLELIRMMQSLRRDKIDLHKFRVTTALKMQELEEKAKMREKVTSLKINTDGGEDIKLE